MPRKPVSETTDEERRAFARRVVEAMRAGLAPGEKSDEIRQDE